MWAVGSHGTHDVASHFPCNIDECVFQHCTYTYINWVETCNLTTATLLMHCSVYAELSTNSMVVKSYDITFLIIGPLCGDSTCQMDLVHRGGSNMTFLCLLWCAHRKSGVIWPSGMMVISLVLVELRDVFAHIFQGWFTGYWNQGNHIIVPVPVK